MQSICPFKHVAAQQLGLAILQATIRPHERQGARSQRIRDCVFDCSTAPSLSKPVPLNFELKSARVEGSGPFGRSREPGLRRCKPPHVTQFFITYEAVSLHDASFHLLTALRSILLLNDRHEAQ